jgi:exopolyphosphatase/guanosine-5'-triphosphate,3'-diphosphate pyrophosphatase
MKNDIERIGLIDLGSNTCRLVIYEIYPDGYFSLIEDTHESVRLGETERDGSLKQTRTLQAISTIKTFKKLCQVNQVGKILAIATAAVRHARNQKTFLNEVYNQTGIRLKVVTEIEEATYVYQGVVNSMEIPKGLIMEIGGGSTKLVYYNRRNVLQQTTFPFGALTLTEKLGGVTAGGTSEETCNKVEEIFKRELDTLPWLKEIDADTQLIGVGGSFRNLARIIRKVTNYPLDMVHNFRLSEAALTNVYEKLRVLNLDNKMKIKGLSSVRADVFPSALAAMKTLVGYCGFKDIVTSSCGLREGVMFNYTVPQTIEKPIGDVLGHSLDTYIATLDQDRAHCEHVYLLALQLFRQLRVLHKFPRAYIRVLRIAAMMSDAGRRFKYYQNAKHTAYMILNSNLYGVTHHDIVMAALVTEMYPTGEIVKKEWEKYADIIDDNDVEVAKRLAVILKLALAFDKSRSKMITEINCDVLGDSVIMKTETGGDHFLEHKEANLISQDFRRVFRKNLDIL